MSTRTLEITHVACMAFLLDSAALECCVLWAGTLFVLCTVCLVCTRTTPAPRTTFGTDDAGKQLARIFQAPDPAPSGSPFSPCLRQCSITTKNCCKGAWSASRLRPRLRADWSKTLMLSFIMCIRLTRSSIIWHLEAGGQKRGQLR